MGKSTFHLALYIDIKGLHWTALEHAKTGWKAVFRKHQFFSQILAEAPAPGQAPAVSPLQISQSSVQVIKWLRAPELRAAVGQFLKETRLQDDSVGLCFSESLEIFRYFSMPKVEKAYWSKAIPIEARKYIPFSIQDCLYDWQATELVVEDRPLVGVIFAAMQKPVYEAAEELLNACGLKCFFVDSWPFAISRITQLICQNLEDTFEFLKEVVLAVYMDSEQVRMTLFAQGVPLLGRSIYLADLPQRGNFVLERRKLDLQATLDFVRRHVGIKSIDHVLLLGPSSIDDESLKNWAAGISEELGIKVEIIRPLRVMLPAEEKWDALPLENWGEMASLGAALQDVVGFEQTHELNLIHQLRETPPKQRALKKIWIATVGLSVLLLVFGYWRHYKARVLEKEYLKIMASFSIDIPGFDRKTPQELEALVDSKIKTAELLGNLIDPAKRFYLARALAVLADLLPRQVWIENFTYTAGDANLLMPGLPNAALSFAGKVRADPGQEQSGIIQEFFKKLKNEPPFANRFVKGGISFQKVDEGAGAGFPMAGLSSRSLLAFTVNLASDEKTVR